jgi:hypothetical protein
MKIKSGNNGGIMGLFLRNVDSKKINYVGSIIGGSLQINTLGGRKGFETGLTGQVFITPISSHCMQNAPQ